MYVKSNWIDAPNTSQETRVRMEAQLPQKGINIY